MVNLACIVDELKLGILGISIFAVTEVLFANTEATIKGFEVGKVMLCAGIFKLEFACVVPAPFVTETTHVKKAPES